VSQTFSQEELRSFAGWIRRENKLRLESVRETSESMMVFILESSVLPPHLFILQTIGWVWTFRYRNNPIFIPAIQVDDIDFG
jgi:hypothetical protein